MLINVIGLGYIGLPTSLILAAKGAKVIGTDLIEQSVNTLNSGKVTFEEDGLQQLYESARANEIKFSTQYSSKADMYIVTVPTPYDESTKKIDASYLISAVNEVVRVSENGAILVIESTVSPGTIDQFIRPITNSSDKKFDLVHAPERILPGSMIKELVNNSRTIGADDLTIGNTVKEVYETFCEAEIVVTSIRVAEMSKVVENTFRDINIAFANELAQICKAADLDVYEVIRIANKHPRVNILSPGPGVGGHCISVDPWFLVGDYPKLTNLILQARKVNDGQPSYVLSRIREIMNERGIKDYSKVGIYGLTYKENVDDVRESPTLQFEHLLKNDEKLIRFFDPLISKTIVGNQFFNQDEFLKDLQLLVVFVNHDELKSLKIADNVVVFDTRNTSLNILNKVTL